MPKNPQQAAKQVPANLAKAVQAAAARRGNPPKPKP